MPTTTATRTANGRSTRSKFSRKLASKMPALIRRLVAVSQNGHASAHREQTTVSTVA